jgi:hypothetical protein
LTDTDDEIRHSDEGGGITPEQCDIDRVDKQHGRLPRDATAEQQAERYRLYQAQALIRIIMAGTPLNDVMRFWTTPASEKPPGSLGRKAPLLRRDRKTKRF